MNKLYFWFIFNVFWTIVNVGLLGYWDGLESKLLFVTGAAVGLSTASTIQSALLICRRYQVEHRTRTRTHIYRATGVPGHTLLTLPNGTVLPIPSTPGTIFPGPLTPVSPIDPDPTARPRTSPSLISHTPLTGYKILIIRHNKLVSAVRRSTIWPINQPLVARCECYTADITCPTVPNEHSSCGIYGLDTMSDLLCTPYASKPGCTVVAKLEAYGKVIPAEYGWRAEKVRLVKIWGMIGVSRWRVRSVARRYGIEAGKSLFSGILEESRINGKVD